MLSSLDVGPTWVLNIRLNCFGSPKVFSLPQLGHLDLSILSSRKRIWQLLHSTNGSVKVSTWPLACQTLGFIKIALSIWYMSSQPSTKYLSHSLTILRLSNVPSGP